MGGLLFVYVISYCIGPDYYYHIVLYWPGENAAHQYNTINNARSGKNKMLAYAYKIPYDVRVKASGPGCPKEKGRNTVIYFCDTGIKIESTSALTIVSMPDNSSIFITQWNGKYLYDITMRSEGVLEIEYNDQGFDGNGSNRISYICDGEKIICEHERTVITSEGGRVISRLFKDVWERRNSVNVKTDSESYTWEIDQYAF